MQRRSVRRCLRLVLRRVLPPPHTHTRTHHTHTFTIRLVYGVKSAAGRQMKPEPDYNVHFFIYLQGVTGGVYIYTLAFFVLMKQ